MAVNIRQHLDDKNIRPRELIIKVDGTALATTLGTGGLLVGADSVTAKDASNVVTITFNRPLRNAEYAVFFQERTVDCDARVTSQAATGFTYTTRKSSDASTAVPNADVDILIKYYDNSAAV